MMWALMIGNAIVEIGWISAMVYLITTNHPYWAVVCVFGALFSGYSTTMSKGT